MIDKSIGGNDILGRPREYSGRGERKKHAKPGEHIMNKNESRLLRKLMSDTELTEKELREHKKYRKMLSDAQKVPASKLSELERFQRNMMKEITKELKLAKEHPKVVVAFKIEWDKYVSRISSWHKTQLGL